MRHSFFILQFDLSFLRVSKSDYVHYLKLCRSYRSLSHEVEYEYLPGIPSFSVVPSVLHFLRIYKSWL